MSNRKLHDARCCSASKEDVDAIKNIDKGLFPQALSKFIPDILGGDPEYCKNMAHQQRAGAKLSIGLYVLERNRDASV